MQLKQIIFPRANCAELQEVEAKITAVDYDRKRISLSIRALLPEEAPVEEAAAEEAADEE